MHNLDRTQLESEQEAYELGHEQGENEQFLGDILGAITGGELEVPLQEAQELELASELLEVSNEQELEQFLGNVFRTVGQAAGQFVRSDTGRALGGILKDAARQALPVVGRAVGDYVSPGSGATGARLAQQAGSLLGLELEGLSPPDQEFEAARQFVRFASAAAKQASAAPRNVAPQTAARAAVVAAAHHHAPGFAHARTGRAPQAAAPRPSTPHPGAAPRTGSSARPTQHPRPVPHAAAPRPGVFVRPPRPTPSRAAAYPRPGAHRPGAQQWRGAGPGPRPAFVRPGQPHHRPGHHRRHPGYQGYPWRRGYQWPTGYTWPTGYAPWGYAAAPAPSGPPAGYASPTGYAPPPAPVGVPAPAPPPAHAAPVAAPQRGEWGRWQRRGSVIVIYGA
jgi:hypothetical protein